MPYYLLGDRSQPEEIGAVAIYTLAVEDERGEVVGGASSQHEAEEMRNRFAVRYPGHSFSIHPAR